MATFNKNKFCVVTFLQLPYKNIDNYVCVPQSWIKSKCTKESKVLVAYPQEEDPVITRNRIEREETSGENWKYHLAVVKHDTDDYDNAIIWMTLMDDDEPAVPRHLIGKINDPRQEATNSTTNSDIATIRNEDKDSNVELTEGGQPTIDPRKGILYSNRNRPSSSENKGPMKEHTTVKNIFMAPSKLPYDQEMSDNVTDSMYYKRPRKNEITECINIASIHINKSLKSSTENQLSSDQAPSPRNNTENITSDMEFGITTAKPHVSPPEIFNERCKSRAFNNISFLDNRQDTLPSMSTTQETIPGMCSQYRYGQTSANQNIIHLHPQFNQCPTEPMNCVQSRHFYNDRSYTPPARQKSLNSIKGDRNVTNYSQRKQHPAVNTNMLNQDSYMDKRITINQYDDHITPALNFTQRRHCLVAKLSDEKQNLVEQRYENLNHTVLAQTTETEYIQSIRHPGATNTSSDMFNSLNMPNIKYPAHYFSNLENYSNHLFEHGTNYSRQSLPFTDPRTQVLFAGEPIKVNYYNQMNYRGGIINNVPLTEMHVPSSAHRLILLSKRTLEKQKQYCRNSILEPQIAWNRSVAMRPINQRPNTQIIIPDNSSIQNFFHSKNHPVFPYKTLPRKQYMSTDQHYPCQYSNIITQQTKPENLTEKNGSSLSVNNENNVEGGTSATNSFFNTTKQPYPKLYSTTEDQDPVIGLANSLSQESA